jgi:hypothetical protein
VKEYEFDIRLPQPHTMPCPGSYVTTRTQLDTDWLCTFEYGGTSGYIYVQATPVSCRFGSYKAIFELESRIWLSIAGEVHQLTNAAYNWGGGHHLDSVTFEWEQRKFTYGHSSLRYARTCQSMDCATVSAVDGTLIEDGCTAERRLPVACVPILSDGTHRPLVDTFAPCVNNPETSCTQSGGTVGTGKCCDYTYQFPNTCMPATASCDASTSCTNCICPAGSCFNGSECKQLDAN